MTDKPTPEQIQRACDLASEAAGMHNAWTPKDYRHHGCLTALADTIAKLDAMQAERDKARAGQTNRLPTGLPWCSADFADGWGAKGGMSGNSRSGRR